MPTGNKTEMTRPFSWAADPQSPHGPYQESISDNISMTSWPHHDEGHPSRGPTLPPPYYHYRHIHRRHSHSSQSTSGPRVSLQTAYREPQSFYNSQFSQDPQDTERSSTSFESTSRDLQHVYDPQIFQNARSSHPPPAFLNARSSRPPQLFLNPQGFQSFDDIAWSEHYRRTSAPAVSRYSYPYIDPSTGAVRESNVLSFNALGPDSPQPSLDLSIPGASIAPSEPSAPAPTGREAPDTQGLTPDQKPSGPDPAENFKPKSLRFWLIMLSNFLAIFLVALDRTIIATAVPRITDDFKSLGDIGWYGSAYMLTTAASQLLFGRVYKFHDVKWTYMAVIVVFEAGSIICAAAPTSAVFIAGRAIAGFGSAGIFSGSMMVMIPMIPLPKRPVFQAIFGMVFGFSSVIGPLLGGVFTGTLSWRWCFWINLPVGGVALLCLILFLPPTRRKPAPPVGLKTHILRLDPLGTFFFMPSIVALLLALQWGGATYAWNDARIVALFLVFAVLFAGFAAVQLLMPDTATVPLRIIRQRSMLAGTFYTIFLSGSMILAIYYVPLWFQTSLGVDPVKSGIYTIPLVLSIVVSSVISGAATQKLGYYVPSMLLCPAIMAVGEGLLSTMTSTTPSSRWIAYQFLTGFGLGFGMQTVNLAVQTVFGPEDVSTGVAISFFAQQLGAAIFVSVGQSILNNLLVGRLAAANIPGIGGGGDGRHVVTEAGATGLLDMVDERFRPKVVEAYNFACTRVFMTGMGLAIATFLAASCMQWKNIKKAKPGEQGEPGGQGSESSESPSAEKRSQQGARE